MPLTNDRSIFSSCTGSFCSCLSVAYPVPKSSTESRTPSAAIDCRLLSAFSVSLSSPLSVISSVSRPASSWRSARIAATRSDSPGVSMSCAETLIETFSSRPRAVISAAKRTPSAMTHGVISRMKPVCSANGMNSPGGTRPRVGWFQRTSPSTPTISPLVRSSLGW